MEERWTNDGQTMEKEGSCKPVICDGISMGNWKMTFLRQYLELSDILIIFAFDKLHENVYLVIKPQSI